MTADGLGDLGVGSAVGDGSEGRDLVDAGDGVLDVGLAKTALEAFDEGCC